ncbi:MAG: acyl-CoA thioesterase [Myxacorys chilensis ATA2-1-KO14]|jgi:1,4-dihydroxy-2-naphthoyl-CoA hydrolase|nr:acyl-CoA thioesterase [Myxacorys chilensis ATA2-1-KO14]
MSFTYPRTIRFQETDAAGVVYFANLLSICHEAYEASLIESGIEARRFFGKSEVAVPIVHANVDFLKPMYCGDRISLQLTPTQINDSTFEIRYNVFFAASELNENRLVSKALTRHVCIDPQTKTRKALSSELLNWLEQTRSQ